MLKPDSCAKNAFTVPMIMLATHDQYSVGLGGIHDAKVYISHTKMMPAATQTSALTSATASIIAMAANGNFLTPGVRP